MAQAMLKDSKMRMIFETGLNGKGEPVFKAKTYQAIKKNATAEQIYETASALAALCKDPLSSVERNDSFEIF